jgi:uncharacterized protein (DUF305 family)
MKFIALISFALLFIGCGANRSNDNHAGHDTSSHNSNGPAPATNAAPAAGNTNAHSHGASSPGAANAAFELQFLDTMIAHHQGAVEMAMLAETRSAHAEVKELAVSIISEQEREISKMAEWRNGWYDGKPEAINMDFPGMSKGMAGMDTSKLQSLSGHAFDVEFLRQMIPHHEGAIEMAKALKGGTARPELKELADDIITAQDAEIKQMREWLAKW